MQQKYKEYFTNIGLDFSIEISGETLAVLFPDFPRKKGEKLTCAEAFGDLLRLAVNQQPGGDDEEVHVGIVDVGITRLAERWNWHRTTARSFLKKLQHADALILDETLPNKTLILLKGVKSSRRSSPDDGGSTHNGEGVPQAVRRPPAPV